MIKFIRWIRGYVVFELKGKFPERFINLCVRLGISLFNPVPGEKRIRASMLLCDYRNIRTIARKSGVALKVTERHGLPFVIDRYRLRGGLLAGAAVFAAIIIVMQNFVWTVEINGLSTVSYVEFSKVLQEAGIKAGKLKGNLDLQGVQRSVMQSVEEIGWMSINIIGTKAEVEVKEKDKKPQIQDCVTPCNIKASEDGIILNMDIKRGKAVVPVGSAVKKGQLLISGVVENSLQNINFVHSDAQIIAKTTETAVFEANLKGEYKGVAYTACRHRLGFLWGSIPVSFDSVSGDYTSYVVTKNLFLNSTALPCSLSYQYCNVYTKTPYNRSRTNAEIVTAADEALYRMFTFSNCETVDVHEVTEEIDDVYRLRVKYVCTQDIGYSENFVVN